MINKAWDRKKMQMEKINQTYFTGKNGGSGYGTEHWRMLWEDKEML